jgi:transcriptional regulator with XRE-family HTH domain
MARKASKGRQTRIYFREHRKKKGLTLAQVAARLEEMGGDLPTTDASLSRIETRKQPYSEPVVEALAEIYGIETWELFGRDPTKAGHVVFMGDYPREEEERAKAVLEALQRSRA